MSFKNKKGGFFDVIRCDQKDYLIWKWHPSGTELGKSKREFAIRTNSKLRVKDGEVAVFVYKQKDETMQDYIVGPFDKTIKTGNFPILQSIIGILFEGDSPFQAEIYFINLAQVVQVKFGVPFFNVSDPFYPHFTVPVSVRGTITFKIDDYKGFIKCHRLDSFTLDEFQSQIRDVVNRYVKDTVANTPSKHSLPLVAIESKTGFINDIIEEDIKNRLFTDFGITVTGVDIGHIELDKECEEYIELKRITKDVVIAKAEIDLANYQEMLRIQREEHQYSLHMGTKTANLSAYQIEKQTEVGVAGAEALGKMGENGAGEINLGNGGGFNPMSMMAGMIVGGAVGNNIAGTINGTMTGISNVGNVPPTIPITTYHVAKDGKDVGTFDVNQIKEMINNGTIDKNTLVWKQGLPQWIKASEVEELKDMFPPEIPK